MANFEEVKQLSDKTLFGKHLIDKNPSLDNQPSNEKSTLDNSNNLFFTKPEYPSTSSNTSIASTKTPNPLHDDIQPIKEYHTNQLPLINRMGPNEIRHLIEMTFVGFYMLNSFSKYKVKNTLGMYVIILSVFSLIAHSTSFYTSFIYKILKVGQYHIETKNLVFIFKNTSEVLLVSSAFLINFSILSKLYGICRIPLFIYFLNSNGSNIINNSLLSDASIKLIYGIELIIAAFFLLSNIFINSQSANNKKITNYKSLVFLFLAYSLLISVDGTNINNSYLLNIFNLPFKLNEHNLKLMVAVKQVNLIFLYLVITSTICNNSKYGDNEMQIVNAKDILANEEERLEGLISFSE